MYAAVFTGPARPLNIEQLEIDPPRRGEVALRMLASGLRRADGGDVWSYLGVGTFGERSVVPESAAVAMPAELPAEVDRPDPARGHLRAGGADAGRNRHHLRRTALRRRIQDAARLQLRLR